MTLSEQEHAALINWIKNNFIPIETFCDIKDSYGIKHIFEFSPGGFYVDNDTMKFAMLECGFRVRNKNTENWVFNISRKSPAFTQQYPGYPVSLH